MNPILAWTIPIIYTTANILIIIFCLPWKWYRYLFSELFFGGGPLEIIIFWIALASLRFTAYLFLGIIIAPIVFLIKKLKGPVPIPKMSEGKAIRSFKDLEDDQKHP